jgi:hypothetical protein
MVFLLPFAVVLLGAPKPLSNEVNFMLWRPDTVFRLLLKGVKRVDSACETYGVHGVVCVAGVVIDHFENPCSSEALEGLRTRMLVTFLSQPEGIATSPPCLLGKLPKVPTG